MLIVQAKQSNHANNFSNSDLEDLQKQLTTFNSLKNDIAQHHNLLGSLRFKRQPERYSSITKAHEQTFSWILDPSSADTEARKLRCWLEQKDGGIFWVSGKPGSGKSTLMKFVADHEETKKILSIWANPRKLVIASHYFWWSGTTLQKSQEGLLRALLYSILKQCPDLIPVICEKWANGPNASTFEEAESDDTGLWSLENLHSAFSAIAHRPDLPFRFCFFIDGLDEYEGDHKEICDAFIHLVKVSSAIKICLSSRPWNVFEQALGYKPNRIYIHDLTREDIRRFVQSRLSHNTQWQALSLESSSGQSLVHEVTERAHGVFLWVFLVTRLLREGLTNGDSLADLQLRLEVFPSDLESFFKDILNRVDRFYHAKMSTALQMTLAAEEPLDVSLYALHEEEFENSGYAIDKTIGPLSDEAVNERNRVMALRLNGWSKGLVEVRNQEVHFLHRTVVDFLRTRDMEDFLAAKSPSWFCASLSILKAYLARIKTTNFSDSLRVVSSADRARFELLISKAMKWAFEIQATLSDSSPVHVIADLLLDDMERSIEKLFSQLNVGSLGEREIERMQKFFRESLIRRHLSRYLFRKLLVSPDYFQTLAKPALSVLIEGQVSRSLGASWPKSWKDTLRCLLAAGQDPNQNYREPDDRHHDCTPWTRFISTIILWDEGDKEVTNGGGLIDAMHDGLFSLFLEHGADPNALIFRRDTASPVFSIGWVDVLMMCFKVSSKPSDEEVYLEELNAFVRHGARIDALSWSSGMSWESDEVFLEGPPAYQHFFSLLTLRIKATECNASLLEKVTKVLLSKMQDSRMSLDWALEKAAIALSRVNFQQLNQYLGARQNAVASGNKKRKRRKDKSSRRSSKRQMISK